MGADYTTYVTRGQAEMRVSLGALSVSDRVLQEVLHLIESDQSGHHLEFFEIRADAADLQVEGINHESDQLPR